MTGIKYLNFIADIFGVSADDRRERIHKYADMFGLTADLAQPISAYSHGMKQKLAIISAWIHEPKLIIMDEPFVGLDPAASHLLKGMMREVCNSGGAIFFSTHVLEVAEKLCDKVAIIKAESSSAPAQWKRSRATPALRTCSSNWREKNAENTDKKQLLELNKSFFVDRKTGKGKSPRSATFSIVLFILLMIFAIGGMFCYMSYSMRPLITYGMSWLYFAIMGATAALFGVFGSVFNTYSSLYDAKDNDLLLSMPIPVRDIMAARLIGVYLMGLMYSGVVVIPAVGVYFITAHPGISGITAVIMAVMVTVLVLILSCILGWVVAKIAVKLKNKSIITVIVSIAFLGGYYYVYFRANEIITGIVANSAAVAAKVRTSAYLLYISARRSRAMFCRQL